MFKAFLLPLFISVFFYYIIKPLNNIFLKKGLKNNISSLLTIILSMFIFSAIFFYLGVHIVYELKELKSILENKKEINKTVMEINKYINLEQLYKNLIKGANKYIEDVGGSILKGFNYIMDGFSKILLIVITIFYLFKDGHKIKDKIIKMSPDRYKKVIDKILQESNEVFSHYVVGQSKVALSLGTMIFIGYKIIGMPNALILSSITFILAFIPFVGFFISMIVPWIIAFTMGLNMMIKLALTFIIVQTLKGRIVVPMIMGHTMKIHPLTDIFLVIGAVALGGPIAAFLVVPLYGILKVACINIYKFKVEEKLKG